ncbi:MAG TPA: hypothetical protein VF269_01680 [Rhodanobacteraceae bacterium]
MKTEHIEQTLMCTMFVVCAALVFTFLAVMLAVPVEPVSVAHMTAPGLAHAASTVVHA